MSNPLIPPTPSTKDYTKNEAYVAQAEANAKPIFDRKDPVELFREWLAEARQKEPNDSNAMSVATVDESGMPDVRMVLLKGVDERGFVFYTNSQSTKGQQLAGQPKAAIGFHWKSLRRQVRIRGPVSRVSEEESDNYFASRARGSQLGAWASDQSRAVNSREALEAKVKEIEKRFDGKDIPRPPHWFGWRVEPTIIEFWRDRPFRLHDRLLFEKADEGWITSRLCP